MTISTRPAPGPSRTFQFPRFERTALPNGLQIIVSPVRKLPVVTVLAVIDAGATSDPPGREGLAQLTAGALREGTVKHDGIQVLEGFEKLGSSLEAGADWDSTVVSMTLLRDKLTAGLELMTEVLTSPSFPEREVERLKAERLAERAQILAEPRGLADESFSRFLYAKGSRYSEPMAGTTASVSVITRDEATAFFASRYTPDAVTVIVVGDIDTEEAVKLISATLGGRTGKRSSVDAASVTQTRRTRAVEIIAKDDAAQAELRLGHIGIPRSHPDYFNVVVMNALLGGLFSSRINLNLRERHGYTYGASSFFDWRREPGPFVIATAVQSEVSAAAISETLKEIDGMRTEEVPEEELSLATSYLEGVFPIRYETTASIASALANLVVFGLPENFYDAYRENIHAVRPSDVLRAAQAYVFPEMLQIVVVGDPAVVKEPIERLELGDLSVRPAAEA
ncbi:MAG: insulinase family protein [Gemmatimonadota bacterium]|nr:insulinase family protein [Gemmatimonadota bacterium]